MVAIKDLPAVFPSNRVLSVLAFPLLSGYSHLGATRFKSPVDPEK